MNKSVHREKKTVLYLGAIGFACWTAIALVYFASGLDWLDDSDSGWYWDVTQNLDGFDPAVAIGFPLIWRGLTEALPDVSPSILGQAVSLLAYVGMIPAIYMIFAELEIPFVRNATLLVALFPFVGVVNSVFPRANAVLMLLTFVAILAYLKDWTWVFIFAVAMLPLFHRSILPALGLLVLIGLWEHKVRWWMLVPMGLPLAVYWVAGAFKHDDLLWYLSWYETGNSSVLGLPIADGLFGTLVLGFRGSLSDLIQGSIMLGYWVLAFVLLFSRVWQSHHFLLALILPIIVLGLIQPEEQIWSMYQYTVYSGIPLVVYLHKKNYAWVNNSIVWATILTVLFISQFAWAIYNILYLS